MGCAISAGRVNGDAGEFHRKYVLGRKLGEGSFGQVRAAQNRSSREIRAVKVVRIIDENSTTDQGLVKAATRELTVWKHLKSNDFCVRLYEHYVDQSLFYFVMEKCEWSMMDRLQEMPHMTEADVAQLFREMIFGIRHCHFRGVVHRDIKPNNFLLGTNGRVKLCDFGMAAQIPGTGDLLRGCYGTAPYMSPEMVSSSGHRFSTDIWSFGATAYVMLYGAFPHAPHETGAKAMKAAIRTGEHAPEFKRCTVGNEVPKPPTEIAESFLRGLLIREKSDRPTAEEALKFRFMKCEVVKNLGKSFALTDSLESDSTVSTLVASNSSPELEPHATCDLSSLAFSANGKLGPADEQDLVPVIREAQRKSHQFKTPVDDIVQHTVDEVLKKLQEVGNAKSWARSFSEPAEGIAEDLGEPVARGESKRSTHTGFMRTPHHIYSDSQVSFNMDGPPQSQERAD